MNIIIRSDNLSNSALFGIERSTYLMLKALKKIHNEKDYTIKLYLAGWECKDNLSKLPFKTVLFPGTHISRIYRLLKRLHIDAIFRFCKFHNYIFHINCNYGYVLPWEKYILTVHDIIEYQRSQDERFRRMYKKNIENSLAIATVSEYSKKDILDNFDVNPAKISVILHGCDNDTWYVEDRNKVISFLKKEIDKSYGSYFLSVSCADIRKNITTLLKAFSQYVDKGGCLDLVLLWKTPPHYLISEYKKLIDERRIIILGVVSDDSLRMLYNGAFATYFISLYEGFGFPILESMACGTPVVTCMNSSLPEVAGNAAIYVGEKDIDAISKSMLEWESGTIDRTYYSTMGMENVKRFSWDKAAVLYDDFYKKVVDSF